MQPRPRRIREELLDHGWWLVPLALLVWFRQLELPTPAPGPDPDGSWHAVKGWELSSIVRLGIDSVFTYGRLGWFHDAPDSSALFAWKFWGWELALKLVLCGLCALAVPRAQGRLGRVVFALALLSVSAGFDALAFVALLALFQRLLAAEEVDARGELAWLLVAALLAQVKFTYFLLWAAGLVLLGAVRGAASIARGLGAFLFLWILLGQSPLSLWAWLRTSLWIASGYNEAMSFAGPARELWLSLAMLAVLVGVLACGLARAAQSRALLLLVLATALLAWRTSFTRQIGNSDVFFSVAPVAACFALRGRVALLGCVALLGAGAWGLAHSHPLRDPTLARLLERRLELSQRTLGDLVDPAGLRERLDQRASEIAGQWDLHRVRDRVGQETLDVFQNSQAIAMLNGLAFHPRPVFQSYSAYTPELLELNRAFYAGEDAPRFVLYRVEPIDGRLAPAEDAPAFAELLRRYRPCFQERDWLLLERASEARPEAQSAPVETRELAFGEWLELAGLSGAALELKLDPRPSLRGQLAALLLRGPLLECEFERSDGSSGRARLVPGAARAGFLVRPFVETQAQLVQLFLGQPVAGLSRLRVLVPEGEEPLWEPRLEAALRTREGLLPERNEELARMFEFAYFQPPPAQIVCEAGVREAEQRGRRVHVFPAPAALRWRLEPGRYRMRGGYGLLDAAWQTEEASDGALVLVVLQQGREVTQLLRRLLDPRSLPEDRGEQPVELEFEVHETAELFVRMREGWHEDSRRDWVFWDDIRIERL